MKKTLCFLLCLTLIFSSVSLCFAATADWTTTDQSNLSNASSKLTSIYNTLTSGGTIYNLLTSISNTLIDIKNNLFDDGHDVAYWANSIASWMQPIYSALTNTLVKAIDLEPIISGLNEVVSSGGNTTYTPYLKYGGKSNANWLSDLYTLDNVNGFEGQAGGTSVTVFTPSSNGSYISSNINFSRTGWRTSVATMLLYINNNIARAFRYNNDIAYSSYGTSQTAVNWTDIDSYYTFTPTSATNGIYSWLATIQNPVARLSYVLASDERIEAQEASAANEQAVVDNFIDSSGNGSTSPSDIGSISDLSSGYKQNFRTDASPSGIFDIFNSDHATWFSQETKNQLDTTNSTRLTKGSASETPLLDKQIEDIYNALGVKQP